VLGVRRSLPPSVGGSRRPYRPWCVALWGQRGSERAAARNYLAGSEAMLGHSAKMSFYSWILYAKFFDREVSYCMNSKSPFMWNENVKFVWFDRNGLYSDHNQLGLSR
jgi:hypothetical protein